MSPETPDLRDEANLPPLVCELLAEGQAVIEAERRAKELEAEAAAGARRAILRVNCRIAADAMLQLEPKVARLMPWAAPAEDELAFISPPEFQEMTFEFRLPGFNAVVVRVRRSWEHVCEPTIGRVWHPWELGPFCVAYPNSSKKTEHASLGVALAHAREQWLKDNLDADIPF